MCGRFVAASSVKDLVGAFSIREVRLTDWEPTWNLAPTDPVRVVTSREGVRTLEQRKWGLVPHWADDASEAAKRINARAETVHEIPTFRDAFARRRCIVPSDGFYEWRRRPDSPSQPYFIRAVDGSPLAFAGLRATWGPSEEPLRTCAIITTEANTAVADVHDRMPVILPADAWDGWLNAEEDDIGYLRSLLVPAPDDYLEMVPVGRMVNSVRNDGPELVGRVPEVVQEGFGF